MPSLLDPIADPTNRVDQTTLLRRQQQEALMRERQQATENAAAAAKREADKANTERLGTTMKTDALQWAGDKTNPQYHVAWDALPEEAKQHFLGSYGDASAKAPEAYNAAFTQQGGLIPGLEHLHVSGSATDEQGNTHVQRAAAPVEPAHYFDPSKPVSRFDPETGKTQSLSGGANDMQFDQFTTPQDVEARMPQDELGIAKQLSKHDISIANLSRFPANVKMSIINAAQVLNPEWRAADFSIRQKSRGSFTSGPLGATKTAINTAIHHLDTVLDHAKAMNNTSSPALNSATNWIGRGVGTEAGKATRSFDVAAGLLASELAKLVKGGTPTQGEIREQQEHFSHDLDPDTLRQNIETAVDLLSGKLDGLRTQYQDAYSAPNEFGFIDDDSRRILQKHGFDPEQIDPRTGAKQPSIPDKSGPPTLTDKSQFDALPSGAEYIRDGARYRKP